ncbi:DUF4030 domain-containing protein [Sutcliffiella sp. NPDC057660]|uniref:DUF4030 domain-containing protein n=1 Tax=Sutcliffiella sp. NPDC057660 TaxID=3346199 RepID=UPI003690D3F5
MKKSAIGIFIMVCIAVGAILLLTNNSEGQVTLAEDQQVVDPQTANKELSILTMSIMEGLKDYEVVVDIQSEYQKSITIQTSINSTDANAKKLTKEIEDRVNEIMKSEELNSLSRIESYEIYVRDKDGENLN